MDERTRHVAYRFRAFPMTDQVACLERWQHAQRALWNAANTQRLERLRRADGYDPLRSKPNRFLSAYDQHAELTGCRSEFEWLRAVPQMVQQDLLTQLDRAWQRFFKRAGGRPRLKRKTHHDWAPLGLPARECKRLSRKRIRLPKLGDLRVKGHRSISGHPVRVAITRDADQWFVSITCELTESIPVAPSGVPVGLDLGVANVIADSNGMMKPNPKYLALARRRIVRAQRTAARRKPKRGQSASNNFRKATRRVALLHRKVRRQRADMLHVLSNHYANNHGVVVIEDLRVRAMTASARGTEDHPGARVRQKAGLNRSVLDVGWYELRRQLGYKCDRSGATLLVVDPRNTSLNCPKCLTVASGNRVTQARFVCIACGYSAHADVNAAQNILARGLGRAVATTVPVCGGLASRRPMNQKELRASALQTVLPHSGRGRLTNPPKTAGICPTQIRVKHSSPTSQELPGVIHKPLLDPRFIRQLVDLPRLSVPTQHIVHDVQNVVVTRRPWQRPDLATEAAGGGSDHGRCQWPHNIAAKPEELSQAT